MKEIRRYSEAFKLQVIEAIESGKYENCHEAALTYGIKGDSTVYNWVRKYGRNHLIGKVIRVETPDERREIKRLKEENKKLKNSVSDLYHEMRINKELFVMVCEKTKTDPSEFKKK